MRTALLTLMMLLIGCAHDAPIRPAGAAASAPATNPARPVAAVWYDLGYPRPGYTGEMQALIVAVWSDGKIVWSDNRRTGGVPYQTAAIDPTQVDRLLADLDRAGFFTEPRENNYGPDASHMVLAADSGTVCKRLASWHEPPSDNPNRVVDERGIWNLKPGETRPAPSPAYAQFIQTWSTSRALIEQLIPARGEPVSSIDKQVFRLGSRKQ